MYIPNAFVNSNKIKQVFQFHVTMIIIVVVTLYLEQVESMEELLHDFFHLITDCRSSYQHILGSGP